MSNEHRERRTSQLEDDPADRPQPQMIEAMDEAGVPHHKRSHNAGGDMSETIRSRDHERDDDDDDPEHREPARR